MESHPGHQDSPKPDTGYYRALRKRTIKKSATDFRRNQIRNEHHPGCAAKKLARWKLSDAFSQGKLRCQASGRPSKIGRDPYVS